MPGYKDNNTTSHPRILERPLTVDADKGTIEETNGLSFEVHLTNNRLFRIKNVLDLTAAVSVM